LNPTKVHNTSANQNRTFTLEAIEQDKNSRLEIDGTNRHRNIFSAETVDEGEVLTTGILMQD